MTYYQHDIAGGDGGVIGKHLSQSYTIHNGSLWRKSFKYPYERTIKSIYMSRHCKVFLLPHFYVLILSFLCCHSEPKCVANSSVYMDHETSPLNRSCNGVLYTLGSFIHTPAAVEKWYKSILKHVYILLCACFWECWNIAERVYLWCVF